jgi:hypothetical protein
MARSRTGSRRQKSFVDSLPEMISHTLAQRNDFILTFETDPDTGSCRVHAFSGKFITSCMLRKLEGLAESERDEGSLQVSCDWV